jgi:hypothetical protein
MSKTEHEVWKEKDGSRFNVTRVNGEASITRMFSEHDWFDVVAPTMLRHCLKVSENHGTGCSVWDERSRNAGYEG